VESERVIAGRSGRKLLIWLGKPSRVPMQIGLEREDPIG
jgi:hypothetical protein